MEHKLSYEDSRATCERGKESRSQTFKLIHSIVSNLEVHIIILYQYRMSDCSFWREKNY